MSSFRPGLILARICILPIQLYRCLISPLLPPACRFYPSCSVYAMQAILRHGPLAGGWLALKRICRCHPFGGSGYDPVPPKMKKGTSRSPHSHAGK